MTPSAERYAEHVVDGFKRLALVKQEQASARNAVLDSIQARLDGMSHRLWHRGYEPLPAVECIKLSHELAQLSNDVKALRDWQEGEHRRPGK